MPLKRVLPVEQNSAGVLTELVRACTVAVVPASTILFAHRGAQRCLNEFGADFRDRVTPEVRVGVSRRNGSICGLCCTRPERLFEPALLSTMTDRINFDAKRRDVAGTHNERLADARA